MAEPDKLTPEQEIRVAEIKEEWKAVALSTERIDRDRCLPIVEKMCGIIKNDPTPTLFVESPMQGQIAATILSKEDKRPFKISDLQTEMDEKIAAWNKKTKPSYFSYSLWGAQESYWPPLFLFCKEIGVKFEDDHAKALEVFSEYCNHCGWLMAFERLAIMSDRPTSFFINENGLHTDGEMAVRYADGWGVYALNGVRVPKWLAVGDAKKISPAKFAKLDNVEIRREFIRKVGMERIAKELGTKSLDTQGDYELLMIDLGGDTGEWPYLKMKNPSLGCWHLECVEKEAKTVQDAINFRASRLKSLDGDWKPEVLT